MNWKRFVHFDKFHFLKIKNTVDLKKKWTAEKAAQADGPPRAMKGLLRNMILKMISLRYLNSGFSTLKSVSFEFFE